MATAKLILDVRKAKKNGTYPLKLVISHKAKTSHLPANISISEKSGIMDGLNEDAPTLKISGQQTEIFLSW